MIITLEKDTDFEKILTNNTYVLVDFNATWCGPCRMMGRNIDDINRDNTFPSLVFLKVDTDKFPDIAMKYAVMSIPTLIPFVEGKQVKVKENGAEDDIILGFKEEDDFKAIIRDTFGF